VGGPSGRSCRHHQLLVVAILAPLWARLVASLHPLFLLPLGPLALCCSLASRRPSLTGRQECHQSPIIIISVRNLARGGMNGPRARCSQLSRFVSLLGAGPELRLAPLECQAELLRVAGLEQRGAKELDRSQQPAEKQPAVSVGARLGLAARPLHERTAILRLAPEASLFACEPAR